MLCPGVYFIDFPTVLAVVSAILAATAASMLVIVAALFAANMLAILAAIAADMLVVVPAINLLSQYCTISVLTLVNEVYISLIAISHYFNIRLCLIESKSSG